MNASIIIRDLKKEHSRGGQGRGPKPMANRLILKTKKNK